MSNCATVLMMTHVLGNLPTAKHDAWVCSSGSKGYCAVKEMLQNGVPGHTLLIESCDLRDVDAACEGCCLLVYCFTDQYSVKYSDHIHTKVRHVVVYANVVAVPEDFLSGCTSLTSVDLSPFSQVTAVQWYLLQPQPHFNHRGYNLLCVSFLIFWNTTLRFMRSGGRAYAKSKKTPIIICGGKQMVSFLKWLVGMG